MDNDFASSVQAWVAILVGVMGSELKISWLQASHIF